jgi:hypothetical protein
MFDAGPKSIEVELVCFGFVNPETSSLFIYNDITPSRLIENMKVLTISSCMSNFRFTSVFVLNKHAQKTRMNCKSRDGSVLSEEGKRKKNEKIQRRGIRKKNKPQCVNGSSQTSFIVKF